MADDFSFLTEIEEEENDNLDNSSSLSTVADVPAEDDQFGFITALPDDEQPVAEVKEDPYVPPKDDEFGFITQIEEPAPEETEVLSVLSPPQKKTFERPEDANVDEDISYDEMSSDEGYMDMLRDYNSQRFGDSGEQKEDETDREYLERFVSHVREFEFNSLDMASQLDWVRTAKDGERMKFGYLYSQLDKLPEFYEEGGTGYLSAIRDFGKSLILDPLNLIGFGSGKVASVIATRSVAQALKQGGKIYGKKMAIEEAAKLAGKKFLSTKAGKVAALGVGVEAGAAAVENLKQQELNILSKKYGDATPTERSAGSAALAAGITGIIGIPFAKAGIGSTKKIHLNVRQAAANQRKMKRELDARNGEFAATVSKEATGDTAGLANGIFDVPKGREALKELGPEPEDAVGQMQFRTELMQRVGDVITDTVRDLANNGQLGKMVNEETKASEVIGNILSKYMASAAKKTAATKGKRAAGKATGDIKEQTTRMLEGEGTEKGLLDFIPDDVDASTLANALEGALSRNKMSSEQFINAMGASYTDAGKYLNTASQVGKIMKGLREIDPQLADAMKAFDNPNATVEPISRMGEMYRKMDRERRALMVTMVSTTMRNVYSAVSRIGMEGTANALESVLYQLGRGSQAGMSGSIPRVTSLGDGLRTVVRDGFGSVERMVSANKTAELSDLLLANQPRLLANMNRSLNELAPDKELSKVTRWLNSLNIAQDLFFRRGVFTDTIDKQMRRAGIIVDTPTKKGQFKSLEEFAASGQSLPSKVLENAVDESLAFTFARIPKEKGGQFGDSIAHSFLKLNEKLGPLPLPIGTAAFPFAKFMVNALQFQFQYSPASVVTGLYQGRLAKLAGKAAEESKKLAALETDDAAKKALLDRSKKELLEAEQRANKARKDFSTGVVGTAALMSAINYRAKNQDTKWFEGKTDDGKTTDLRPYFPITPYLALADMIVKMGYAEGASLGMVDQPEITGEIDVQEFLEGVTGAQFRTGASSFVLDESFKLFKGESSDMKKERLYELTGQYVAELFGGAATPLRVLRDVEAAYDTEAAIVRDARQTTGDTPLKRGVSAFTNVLQKDMPIVSKDLPELQSTTREAPIYRQSSGVSQLFGLPREEAARTPGEKELVRLGIKNFTIVPSEREGEATALVKKHFGKRFEERINKEINSKEYKNKSNSKQKQTMRNILREFRARARQLAKIEARNTAKELGKPFTAFDRAEWGKLSTLQRRLANEWYETKYGMTVTEKQAEDPDMNHLRAGSRIGRAEAKTR